MNSRRDKLGVAMIGLLSGILLCISAMQKGIELEPLINAVGAGFAFGVFFINIFEVHIERKAEAADND